jgi:hypothetical protein
MALKLNGSTGYLVHGAAIATSYPLSMVAWVSYDANQNSYCISQSQSTTIRQIAGWLDANGTSKYATTTNTSIQDSATKGDDGNNPNTTMKLMVVTMASTTSRKMYFAGTTPATSTVSITDALTSHDQVVLGARSYNSGTINTFLNGSIAEAHFFNVELDSTQIGALLADTTKPEDTTGWVDGWMLKNTTDLTSIGGTRTLSLVGGVTNSAQPHPIARSSTTSVSSDLAASYGIIESISSNLAVSPRLTFSM